MRLVLSFGLLVLTKFSHGDYNQEFVVVSTTPSTSNHVVPEIEKLQNYIRENNKRLEKLESRLEKIYNTLSKGSLATQPKSPKTFPSDCKDVQERGHKASNFYYVKPPLAPGSILVFCDMDTKDGGWISILYRFNGSQKFDLKWNDYKHGFGNIAGEFWLGLDNIHHLTGHEMNELLVELTDWESKKVYAHYDSFSVGGEDEGYLLKLVAGYSGDAGDSLSYHGGMKFSTVDKDQDIWSRGSCAAAKGAGWWYRDCSESLLTGKYLKKDDPAVNSAVGIYWFTFHGHGYSFKEAKMMVRPRTSTNGVP